MEPDNVLDQPISIDQPIPAARPAFEYNSSVAEPPSTHSDGSDWETISDDLSLDRPVLKHDLPHLTEVPLKSQVAYPSLKWMEKCLTYSNAHKGYELQMVIFYDHVTYF